MATLPLVDDAGPVYLPSSRIVKWGTGNEIIERLIIFFLFGKKMRVKEGIGRGGYQTFVILFCRVKTFHKTPLLRILFRRTLFHRLPVQ